ncbi:MAG TPA: hypothetical protein VJM34_15155 [Novosphingobium sp.]|nr:hypothetical protein [Novosphingobium sp.]
MLKHPSCLFDRHKPVRREAHWDGQHYVGTCIRCGARIRRRGRGDWRKDWLAD